MAVGADNPAFKESRFGIIASKKVGNAVERNRAKRRVREILREFLPEVKDGKAFIFICFDNIHTASYEALKDSIKLALEKLRGMDQNTSD